MTVLVTGAAGFIGFHLAHALLERGERVLGVDNLNDYYDVTLKEARLAELRRLPGFPFHRVELAERGAVTALLKQHPDIDRVVHLAAQAGVRYSLEQSACLYRVNIEGQLEVLEACRQLPRLEHLVYASSSSVYGGNTKLPFSVDDRVDTPQSLYAATKKANELMAYCYAHLYRLPIDGPALLHGLRSLGTAGHGGLDLHPGDPGGRADPRLQPRQDAPRFHLRRRYRRGRGRLPRPAARR